VKRIYTSHDALIVGHLEQVLKDRGIVCFVKNGILRGGVGELPPTEAWPQLFVESNDDEAVALRIVDEVLGAAAAPGPDWTCPGCNERIEGQFAECWQCGASTPQTDY